jgi:hypothetical protein
MNCLPEHANPVPSSSYPALHWQVENATHPPFAMLLHWNMFVEQASPISAERENLLETDT